MGTVDYINFAELNSDPNDKYVITFSIRYLKIGKPQKNRKNLMFVSFLIRCGYSICVELNSDTKNVSSLLI